MTYRQNGGTSGGICKLPPFEIPTRGGHMALNATFVKNEKPTAAPAGDKHADGGGMYLLITASWQVLAHELPVC
jgi:hypothetical protein